MTSRRRTAIAAIVLGLVGAAVSTTGSWIPSLWGDEAASLMSARRSLPSLAHMITHVDAVHATYYFGLHFWVLLAGTSPFAIRFPSAIAVGVATAAVVLIGERLGRLPCGVVAGVICAVLPRMTYIGEEARSYAFSAAISAWLSLLLLVALRSERRRVWIAYGVLLVIGTYVFLYVSLLALAHLVVLLLHRDTRRMLRAWAVTAGAAVLCCSPLLVLAILERGQISYLADRQEISVASVFVSLWFGAPAFAVAGWILTVAGVASTLARRRRDHRRVEAVLPVAWVVVPSVVLIGTSPVIAGFTARYLALCAPGIALLMAMGIAATARHRRWLTAVTTTVVVALVLPVWTSQRGPYAMNSSDWRQVGEAIAARAHPGDAVVFDEGTRPSRRTRLAYRTYPQYFSGLSDPTLASPYWTTDSWHDSTLTVTQAAELGRFARVDRVWLIEYDDGTSMDHYGLAELRALGFAEASLTRTHRSAILQLIRFSE